MISVCMIAKNESRWIAECLEHIQAFAGEVIVADTGSTDDTVRLAEQKGARVFQIEWENDFSKARNFTLEKALGEWIFILDPDERIAEADMPKIQKLTESETIEAYTFNTRNYSRNPSVSGFVPCQGEYPHEEQGLEGYFLSPKVRLFRNKPSTRFVYSVHELVEPTLQGTIHTAEIPIHHYGSLPEVTEQKDKHNFYKQQGLRKAQQQPQDWKAHLELGLEYIGSGHFGEAIEALEKAKTYRPKEPLVLTNLGFSYMENGDWEAAQATLQECLEVNAQNHDALLNLGVTKMRQNLWQDGLEYFDRLVKAHPQSFTAYRNAGNCFAQLKQFQAAVKCFEQALAIFPQYVDAKVDLGVVCLVAGRVDLAKPILQEAAAEQPQCQRVQQALHEIQQIESA